jgi:hypothetical protein
MTGLRTTVCCFDRLFDKASSDKYYLSIRLEPDGLFYTVYNPTDQKYLAFESAILSGLKEIYSFIEKHEVLKLVFAKTLCIVPSDKYTLIPSPLFIPEKAEEYFKFVHSIETNEEIRVESVYDTDVKMVYSSDISWFEIINDHFPDSKVIPSTAAFIQCVLPRVRNTRVTSMYANLYKDNFDFLLVDDGRLKFCNNFTYKTAEDIAYYTVFVIDQLRINIDKSQLNISGRVNSKHDIIKLLKRYIKLVEILDTERDVSKSYALDEINTYNYPDLFNPRLCE